MTTMITVRDIDPDDKSWLKREAKRLGLSMEELVRRLIHEKRQVSRSRPKPSEVFKQHFGAQNGVELPPRERIGVKPVDFTGPEYAAVDEAES